MARRSFSDTFRDKLSAAVVRNQSRLCIGLDPDPARIGTDDISSFLQEIIAATADLVCCYKPNIAFFEALGLDGWRVLHQTMAEIPADIPVLLDAKRGDVGSTAEAYAKAVFDVLGADAVTVNPYLGHDALQPFLERADRGVFILCRTSNAGAADLQDLAVTGDERVSEPLYLAVARKANTWNTHGNVGLVVGATYPFELARVREQCPELTILVPGIGAQGGDLRRSARGADNGTPSGFLVSASRAVVYAARPGEDPAGEARTAARALRDAINAALPESTPKVALP